MLMGNSTRDLLRGYYGRISNKFLECIGQLFYTEGGKREKEKRGLVFLNCLRTEKEKAVWVTVWNDKHSQFLRKRENSSIKIIGVKKLSLQ